MQELRSNCIISCGILTPDIDLLDQDGDFNPRTDGVKDALSFGIGFTAVPAVYPEPGR